MTSQRTQHAKASKPFRPAGLEPLFGWLSTLQRSQAKQVRAQTAEPLFERPTLRFSLARTEFSLFTTKQPGQACTYWLWNWKDQVWEVYNEPVESLFLWLREAELHKCNPGGKK